VLSVKELKTKGEGLSSRIEEEEEGKERTQGKFLRKD